MDINSNLINIIGVLAGTIIGGRITFKINDTLEKKRFKREIYFSNKGKIDLAYKEVYDSCLDLKKYYYLFIQFGNEFKKSEPYNEFAPLNEITSFINCVEKNEIYLSITFINEYQKLLSELSSHPGLALQLNNNPDLFTEQNIEELSEIAIINIQNFMNFIKKRFEEK